MSEEKPDFLRRWSRLKKESAAVSPSAPVSAPSGNEIVETPVELPPLDSLTFESDFTNFMHAKVEESVKRAALKKLFADPRFNVMDGLDTYIADYTQSDTIPADMFERMARKREKLFNAAAEKAKAEAEEAMPQGEAEEATPQAEASHHDGASNDVDPAQNPKAL
jgi:hypothetical protein